MKVLFILSAVLVVTAQANFFDNIGHAFTNAFNKVKEGVATGVEKVKEGVQKGIEKGKQLVQTGKEVVATGKDIIDAGVDAGKTLASQGFQALVLNTVNAYQELSKTRDVDISEAESAVHGMLDLMGGSLKAVTGQFGEEIDNIIQMVAEKKISAAELVSEVEKLVKTHNVFADAVLKAIESKAGEVITGMVPHHKRNTFTDFLGTSLSHTLKPMIEELKNMATTTGSILLREGLAHLSQ